MDAIDFVVPGAEVEVDGFSPSIVSKVRRVFDESDGRVAECKLRHVDGTEFDNVYLRESEYMDVWKFKQSEGILVNSLLDLREDVESLRDSVESENKEGWLANASVVVMRFAISSILFAWAFRTLNVAV